MAGRDLGWFNGLAVEEAEAALRSCCASRHWAREVGAGRPYEGLDALQAAGVAAVGGLAWADVEEALAAHPRIGDRVAGKDREAGWSRGEQSGVGDEVRAALVEGNRAYEERFGHVFLICATGLGGAEMLAALRERLGNEVDAERVVVRRELGKIAELRLAKLIAGGG